MSVQTLFAVLSAEAEARAESLRLALLRRRFVLEWTVERDRLWAIDIIADRGAVRVDLYHHPDRSVCPRCHAAAYITHGGMWHCDPCAIGWEQA